MGVKNPRGDPLVFAYFWQFQETKQKIEEISKEEAKALANVDLDFTQLHALVAERDEKLVPINQVKSYFWIPNFLKFDFLGHSKAEQLFQAWPPQEWACGWKAQAFLQVPKFRRKSKFLVPKKCIAAIRVSPTLPTAVATPGYGYAPDVNKNLFRKFAASSYFYGVPRRFSPSWHSLGCCTRFSQICSYRQYLFFAIHNVYYVEKFFTSCLTTIF